MTAKTKEIEELQYFRRISALYEKAAPIIRYIAHPDFLNRGLLPVSQQYYREQYNIADGITGSEKAGKTSK